MQGAGVVAAASVLLTLSACDPGGSADSRELASHETSAIVDVMAINKAQASYYSHTSKYAGRLSELCGGNPFTVAAITKRICRGEAHGYVFTVASNAPAESYTIDARPKTPGSSGRRFFYSDQNAIIRQSENAPATANSPPVK